MGKRSTALHVLHHPTIVALYETHQYLVGCDAATSADTLATLILQVLRVPIVAGENILTVVQQVLLAAPPTLLLLDNFESVWHADSSQVGV
jgi:hypothetical protein